MPDSIDYTRLIKAYEKAPEVAAKAGVPLPPPLPNPLEVMSIDDSVKLFLKEISSTLRM